MKYISLIVIVVVALITGYFATSFLGKDSEKDTTLSKTSTDSTASEANSFSVKKAFDDAKGSLDPNQAMVDRGKNYLLMKVDSRIQQLNPFKARITDMADLKAADKDSLVAELSDEISKFESFKPEITKSKTKEDIRIVADKIKETWLKSSASVKQAEEKIIALKENQLILEADTASVGIQKRIDALKASGKDTKNHEKLLSEYSKKIDEAKQDVKSAKEKYVAVASAATEGEKAQLNKDKELFLKSAQQDIKDAYKLITKEAREDFSRRSK